MTFEVKVAEAIVRETRGFKRLFGGPDHAGWLAPETATALTAEAIRWGSLFDFIPTLLILEL